MWVSFQGLHGFDTDARTRRKTGYRWWCLSLRITDKAVIPGPPEGRNPESRNGGRTNSLEGCSLPPPRFPVSPRFIPQNFGLEAEERRHLADLRLAEVEVLQRGEAGERRHIADLRTPEVEVLQRGEAGERRHI